MDVLVLIDILITLILLAIEVQRRKIVERDADAIDSVRAWKSGQSTRRPGGDDWDKYANYRGFVGMEIPIGFAFTCAMLATLCYVLGS